MPLLNILSFFLPTSVRFCLPLTSEKEHLFLFLYFSIVSTNQPSWRQSNEQISQLLEIVGLLSYPHFCFWSVFILKKRRQNLRPLFKYFQSEWLFWYKTLNSYIKWHAYCWYFKENNKKSNNGVTHEQQLGRDWSFAIIKQCLLDRPIG